MNKEQRALKPDHQGFDEIRIFTVPRYKTSGLSGDEWRIHAQIQLMRKGQIVHETGYRDIETAAGFLYAEIHKAMDEMKGYFRGERDFCDQEGCKEKGTTKLFLKKEFCKWGHSSDPSGPTYRLFCDTHKRRGDCGLEDADANYQAEH